jgi:AraC-like DNA-binding protein
MRPRLLDRSNIKGQAFVTKRNRYSHFLKIWHYHPELELVVILESTGTRFVGDNIEKFEAGEVVLIGKNLPHMWLNDPTYFEKDSGVVADALCIHFKEDFLGEEFLNLAATEHLLQLFSMANRGIRFLDLDFPIVEEIKALNEVTNEFARLLLLLQLMDKLARHKKILLLTSEVYPVAKFSKNTDKTQEFIFNNFNKPIQLSEVAAIAKMNPSAFSRYFKRIHRKTFSRYLIELRVGFACKLLMEKKSNISTVCYESGFNNISNFNKQFRSIMNMTPSEYIKRHN